MLAIAQETAHGRDEMESLPGINPAEWFFESWPLFASLFLTCAPAGVLAQSVYAASGSAGTALSVGFVVAGVLLVTIFPFMLLSFLENSAPFSAAVWKGLQLSGRYWFLFTVQSACLVTIGLGLVVLRGGSSSGVLNFVICAGLVVVSMLYFRLLGRLTRICQDKSAEEEPINDAESS
jgi:hypothetical protein